MNFWSVFAVLAMLGILLWLISRKQPAPPAHGRGVNDALVEKGEPSDQVLTVGSFNIHRGKGRDGRRDLRRIADLLRTADLVGLYEVEGPLFGLRTSQAQTIGRLLGLGWLFIPTQYKWLRYNRGNALLSRKHIGRWYSEPMVDSSGRRPRNLLRTRVDTGAGEIDLFAIHMSGHIDQEIQFETIMEHFIHSPCAILMGDLNITAMFPPLRQVLESGLAEDAIGLVLRQDDDGDRVDWILTRGLTIHDGGTRDDGASDHPYYWITVSVPD